MFFKKNHYFHHINSDLDFSPSNLIKLFLNNKIADLGLLNSRLTLGLEFNMALVAFKKYHTKGTKMIMIEFRRPNFVRAERVPNTFLFCNLALKL